MKTNKLAHEAMHKNEFDHVFEFISKSGNHHIDEKHARMFVNNIIDVEMTLEAMKKDNCADLFFYEIDKAASSVMKRYNNIVDDYNLSDKDKPYSITFYSGSYDDSGNKNNYTLKNTSFVGFEKREKLDFMVLLFSTYLNSLRQSDTDPANMLRTEEDLNDFVKRYGNKLIEIEAHYDN